jgi:hypothetical protein
VVFGFVPLSVHVSDPPFALPSTNRGMDDMR